MKRFTLCTAVFLSQILQAQSAPQSLLNQLPYVQENLSSSQTGFLNVNQALNNLNPLPDFQLPARLPNEFSLSGEGVEVLEMSRQANEYLRAGQPQKAVDLFRTAMERWPNEWMLRVALADSLSYLGEHKEAILEYQKVLEENPFHFQTFK